MSTDYKPGTVAIATVRGVPNVRAFYYESEVEGSGWCSAVQVNGEWDHSTTVVTDIRPLIVLDPERHGSFIPALDNLNDALRKGHVIPLAVEDLRKDFEAQTQPARIPEPGRWGVVRDEHGTDWVRTGPTPITSIEWQNSFTGVRLDFNDIPGSPVLIREGVES